MSQTWRDFAEVDSANSLNLETQDVPTQSSVIGEVHLHIFWLWLSRARNECGEWQPSYTNPVNILLPL
jgi:hypothetical protein